RSMADKAIDRFPIGQLFPIYPLLRRISFDVIIRTVFGIEDGAPGPSLYELLQGLFELYASRAGTLFSLWAMRINLGPWSPWGKAVRIQRKVDAILYAEFARRRREGVEGREDILSMLLQARDEGGAQIADGVLRGEMMTLMLAGHETTAASMAWVINRLLNN